LKILFDQGVPKPLLAHLPNHEVHRAFQLGWADKKNGELLGLAEEAGFEVFVKTDQNLLHQQNLQERRIAVFILGKGNWPEVKPYALRIAEEINAIQQPGIYFFTIPSGSQ
jgi:hypothetical protein